MSQALRRPTTEPAPLRIRAANVTAAGSVGTKEFKPWYMVNTKAIIPGPVLYPVTGERWILVRLHPAGLGIILK